MRKRNIGIISSAIVGGIGIGLTILFFILPYEVKSMTSLQIEVGFAIAGLFIVGSVLTAIFTLTSIRKFRYSVLGLPRWLCDTYYWKCYGPRYQIDGPIFKNTEVTEIRQGHYEAKISATVRIWIKSKSKPIKVNLNSTNICLEQRVGWRQQKARFRLNIHQEIPVIMLKPREEWYDQIVMTQVCRGDQESYPVIKKRPRCGVWEIWVTLPGEVRRQLHKGANCQPRLNNEMLV